MPWEDTTKLISSVDENFSIVNFSFSLDNNYLAAAAAAAEAASAPGSPRGRVTGGTTAG